MNSSNAFTKGVEAFDGLRPSFSAHVRWREPNFLYAAPDTTTCAAFSEENRMKCANATMLYRKFEGTWGTRIGSVELERSGGREIYDYPPKNGEAPRSPLQR